MGCSRCRSEQHDPEVGAVDSEHVAVQLQQADLRVLDGLVGLVQGSYLVVVPKFQRRPQPMLDWFAQYMS